MTCQFVLGFGCGNTMVYVVIVLTLIFGVFAAFKTKPNLTSTKQKASFNEGTLPGSSKGHIVSQPADVTLIDIHGNTESCRNVPLKDTSIDVSVAT